jgi:phosphohistidine swiveling domain-containing protein
MTTKSRSFFLPVSSLQSAEEAGGKAWSLAKMTAQGVAVPPGMVLTCESFDRFVQDHGLGMLEDQLGLVLADWPRFAERAVEIRDRVMSCSLPTEVLQILAEWWANETGAWIVRSSAVGEDSALASFAGQLDSVLHVDAFDALCAAVLRCWASYWSERALAYRVNQGVPLRSMGVIIQVMIEPVQGGVLFTRAPDDAESLRIEYVDGHPESLVNGSQTPHTIILPRHAPEHARFGMLAAQALALERAYGAPQDIEWVVDRSDKLWFVQSRPITVPPKAHRSVVWSNVNINENYPEPISPLLYSIARESYENYFSNIGRAFGLSETTLDGVRSQLRYSVGIHGARLYYNLSNIHHCIGAVPFGSDLSAAFDSFVGVDDEGRTGGKTQTNTTVRVASLLELIWVGLSATRSLLTVPWRVERFEARADAYARDAETRVLESLTPLQLLELYRHFIDIRFRRWTDASLADVAAGLSYAVLKSLLNHRLDDDAAQTLPPTLLLAIPNVVSACAVASLWKLSRTARADPALCDKLSTGAGVEDWDALYTALCGGAFPRFYEQFTQHIARWGFRVSGELMLHVACYQEEPATLLPVIAGFIGLEGPSPEASTAAQAERRDTAMAELCRKLGWRWALALRLALRATQRSICYRERVRLKQALIYRRFRGVLLALGERLVEQGRLIRSDDLFYLDWSEIDAWLSGNYMLPGTIPELVALRRRAHVAQSAQVVPDTVQLQPGEYLTSGTQRTLVHRGANELLGVGVSGGKVRARARVMAGLGEWAQFQKGEILVARQTDPGWASLFFLASGLIMERGGMLSHGAIVAREFGIPAVIAVPQATDLLQTGEMLLIDGDQGRVLREGVAT